VQSTKGRNKIKKRQWDKKSRKPLTVPTEMHKLRIKKRDEMAVKAKRRRDNNEKHEGIKKKKKQ